MTFGLFIFLLMLSERCFCIFSFKGSFFSWYYGKKLGRVFWGLWFDFMDRVFFLFWTKYLIWWISIAVRKILPFQSSFNICLNYYINFWIGILVMTDIHEWSRDQLEKKYPRLSWKYNSIFRTFHNPWNENYSLFQFLVNINKKFVGVVECPTNNFCYFFVLEAYK